MPSSKRISHFTLTDYVKVGPHDLKYGQPGATLEVEQWAEGLHLASGAESVLVPWHKVDQVRYAALPVPAPEVPNVAGPGAAKAARAKPRST